MANRLSGQQLMSFLIQNGAKPYEAAILAGNAGAESSYNPYLSHDKGTGYGLWGHRNERWDAMQRFTGQRMPGWQDQAKFALNEWRSRPESKMIGPNSTPEQLARAGMFFERPVGFTPQHPEAGDNYSGRLNNIRGLLGMAGGMDTSPGAMAPAGFTPNASPAEAPPPMLLGSPMPDTGGIADVGGAGIGKEPDYMSQFGKFAGLMGGGGGGGGEQPMRRANIDHFSLVGDPSQMQTGQVQPVQIAGFGKKRRGLLAGMGA